MRSLEAQAEEAPPKVAWETPLVETLHNLLAAVPGVSGIVVADRNGLPVGSAFRGPGRVELVAVSAMAALALEAGKNVARNLALKDTFAVTVEGPSWKVLVSPTPSGLASVLVLMEGSANLGLLKLSLPKVLAEIDGRLETL